MRGEKIPPSQNNSTYWIGAFNRSDFNNNPPVPRYTRKWLLFHSRETIDDKWVQIKAATEAGKLGHFSSVSTAKHDSATRGGRTYTHKVICVFTYYEKDYDDVVRVRDALKVMGYQEELGYKTWKASKTKQYSRPGRSVCKYRM